MEKYLKIFRQLPRNHTAFAGLIGSWLAILVVAANLGVSQYLEDHIANRIEFRVRSLVKLEPPLDPRIKILAIDDVTAAMMGQVRLPPKKLADLLTAIDARKPAVILIDAMFSQRQEVSGDDVAAFRKLANLNAPVVVGALVSSHQINFRREMNKSAFMPAWKQITAVPSKIRTQLGAKIYGPDGAFGEVFRRVGHFMESSNRSFEPAIKVDKSTVIPHLSLYAAKDLRITDAGILVNRHTLALDRNGSLPVDYLSSDKIVGRVRSLSQFFAGNTAYLESIAPGDIVMILTQYSSGQTQFLDSPFGLIPASWALTASVNSVVRGVWLQFAGYLNFLLFALALLGFVIGWRAPTSRFFLWLLFVTLSVVAFAIVMFIWFHTMVPWVVPVIGFTGSAFLSFAAQRQIESTRRIYLESERQTAAVLQRDFLPPADKEHPLFDLAAGYHAAETIGGDWYSYGVIEDRWLYLHLGDVTGHGAASAMLASFAKGATDMLHEEHRSKYQRPAPLGLVHDCLNRIIQSGASEQLYMTLVSLTIDLHSGEYVYLNSGHEPALLLGSGKVTPLTLHGPSVLGHSLESQDVASKSMSLGDKKTIILYSDGLLDASCPPGKKASLRLLRRLLYGVDTLDAASVRKLLEMRSGLHSSRPTNRKLNDDVTFLVVHLRTKKVA
jgi:serine phosphatase RsbU (regulator of sigma subunit)/CHASE2 domain-containing sensor protein